jgi:hypothetical protein
MFNYNLLADEKLQFFLIVFYLGVWLCFVLGNWIAGKLLNPEHKDLGRVFMGSLLLFCTHIFFSILTAWKSVFGFMFYNPIIGVIGFFVSWFFICKYLYGHSWLKAIVAALMPIIVAAAACAIFYLIAPETFMSLTVLRIF